MDPNQWADFLQLIAATLAQPDEWEELRQQIDWEEGPSGGFVGGTPPDDDYASLGGSPFRIHGRWFDHLLMILPGQATGPAALLVNVLHPNDLAVHLALGLVGLAARDDFPVPPPPAALVAALTAAAYDPEHHPPDAAPQYQPGRALEFALAFLLGWHRHAGPGEGRGAGRFPIDGRSCGWEGHPHGAVRMLERAVGRRVRRCLMWLDQDNYGPSLAGLEWCNAGRGVPGVPAVPPGPSARSVLFEMLHLYNGCECIGPWIEGDLDQPERLAAFSRHMEECGRWHLLRSWRPAGCSLWEHLDRAVQGVIGPALEPRPFIDGLLHHALWHEAVPVRLAPQPVAFHDCDRCGLTPYLGCCGTHAPVPRLRLRRGELIRVAGHDLPLRPGDASPYPGTYRLDQFRQCPGGAKTGHEDLLFGAGAPPSCPACQQPLTGQAVPAYRT